MLHCAVNAKIITLAGFCKKLHAFRNELVGPAKRSWLPRRKPSHFLNRQTGLPGTMSQIEVFIQYLPLVLYEELTKESATRFLESQQWSLYLYIKRFFSLVLADRLSEGQVQELEVITLEMLETRIKLTTRLTKPANNSRTKQRKLRKHEFSWLRPKHVFLLQYASIIRHAGVLKQYSTIRKESKNGELKRMAKVGNNKKNSLATLLNVENKLQAATSYDGKFGEEPLTIVELCLEPDDSVTNYMKGVWEDSSSFTHANRICYKGIDYSNQNHQVVLVHIKDKKEFSVGVIRQLLTMSDGEPTVVFEETDTKLVPNLDVYEVTMKGKLGHAKISDLAHYYPRFLYETRNKFLMTLMCMPYLK